MTALIITRGLPGSGKTTWAKSWVAEDPANRARVNRDDLRSMAHDGTFIKGQTEIVILAARDALLEALLRHGTDVVCDDTNLPSRTVRDLRKVAYRAQADLEVKDFTQVSLETCVERDAQRGILYGFVGEKVITDMHDRYLRGKKLPLPMPGEEAVDLSKFAPYTGTPGKPKAVIVDIDGTVALKGTRDAFDESLVSEDQPNSRVIRNIQMHRFYGDEVIFCSGRTDACREDTARWLEKHFGYEFTVPVLHMRKTGDTRKDSIIKLEIFDQHIRNNYDIQAVYDDRNQVVNAYRGIGLYVNQVAPGDF